MKGDFTRNTFNPLKHFSRVLMQQGRVQLDADFNEQASILLHHLRTMMMDLIGPHGGPASILDSDGSSIENTGFVITPINGSDFSIGPGRYYVDGILCENYSELVTFVPTQDNKSVQVDKWMPDGFAFEKGQYVKVNDTDVIQITQVQPAKRVLGLAGSPPTQSGKLRRLITYLTQPDYTDKKNLQNVKFLVYLDVWERHITSIEDDYIREKALRGPDTCTRAKVVWQVKVHVPNGEDEPKCTDINIPKLSNAKMEARIQPVPGAPDECTVLPEARYRGAENQLYRIEIHQGNSDGSQATATFKWSRDNGSIVFPIVQQNGDTVSLQSLGRDERTSLKVGDWVEIIDDDKELRGEPGVMAEVEKVDKGTMTAYLKHLDTNPWPDYVENSTNHPLLRRWDQRAKGGINMLGGAIVVSESSDDWIKIEDGIEIQFQSKPDGKDSLYRTGDYWLIPARAATGKIEWPTYVDDKNNEYAEALPPHGIEHHYAPLAIIEDGNPSCRCSFDPLECKSK